MKRGGVNARNYVLHINKSYSIGRRGNVYYFETTGIPYGGKTRCGRVAATVNGASTGCDYSKDELCVLCLGDA